MTPPAPPPIPNLAIHDVDAATAERIRVRSRAVFMAAGRAPKSPGIAGGASVAVALLLKRIVEPPLVVGAVVVYVAWALRAVGAL